jgi:hypothetical protein
VTDQGLERAWNGPELRSDGDDARKNVAHIDFVSYGIIRSRIDVRESDQWDMRDLAAG